jgi:hypothetical protein
MDEGSRTSETTPIAWVVQAMNTAADRMIDVHWHQPERAFSAIGETLWWACILDEALLRRCKASYAKARKDEKDVRDLLAGLRYARNRFAHSSDIVDYVEVSAITGSNWVGGYQASWRWKHLPSVLGPRGKGGQVEYETALAGHDVKQSLIRALSFLRWAANALT